MVLVTNVSSDHFGEYGIDDLEGLADVKLSVAAVVPADGLLVLNADDAPLRAKARRAGAALRQGAAAGWFALDADCAALPAQRAGGGPSCGVRAGNLLLSGGERHEGGSGTRPGACTSWARCRRCR